MSIAVIDFKKKNSHLKRAYIETEHIEIPELSQTLTKYTVISGEKIKKKITENLKKLCKDYDNVVSMNEKLQSYEKRKVCHTLMTATPVICFKKCLSMSGFQSQTDSFAIIVKNGSELAKKLCVDLCGKMRFVTLYEKEESNLSDVIIEKTGVCVKKGEYGNFKEKMCLFVGDNLEIVDFEKNIRYYDIEYSKNDYDNNYSQLPMNEILNISILEADKENYIKSKKVKIMGVKSKKW